MEYLIFTFKQPAKAIFISLMGLMASTALITLLIVDQPFTAIIVFLLYLSIIASTMLGSYFSYRDYKQVEFRKKLIGIYRHLNTREL